MYLTVAVRTCTRDQMVILYNIMLIIVLRKCSLMSSFKLKMTEQQTVGIILEAGSYSISTKQGIIVDLLVQMLEIRLLYVGNRGNAEYTNVTKHKDHTYTLHTY